MNNIEKEWIKKIHRDIANGGEFPEFGSPEIECNKCMFYEIVCPPSSERVGCYRGWKREINEV